MLATPFLVAASDRIVLRFTASEWMARSLEMHRLAVRFGLPVLPEWGEWFHAELVGQAASQRRRLHAPLRGRRLGWYAAGTLLIALIGILLVG